MWLKDTFELVGLHGGPFIIDQPREPFGPCKNVAAQRTTWPRGTSAAMERTSCGAGTEGYSIELSCSQAFLSTMSSISTVTLTRDVVEIAIADIVGLGKVTASLGGISETAISSEPDVRIAPRTSLTIRTSVI
jgi:hypothetical protein